MEIFYVLCIIYGVLLSGKAKELHHGFFELIPGFVWGNPVSMVWGAVYLGVLAWIVGFYIAWMHNASIITGEK
jgi:Na+/serine symporter